MADSDHKIVISIEDNTKPKGPKAPTMQQTLVNVIVLCIALACLGMLNGFIWSIGDLVSKFDNFPCCF